MIENLKLSLRTSSHLEMVLQLSSRYIKVQFGLDNVTVKYVYVYRWRRENN